MINHAIKGYMSLSEVLWLKQSTGTDIKLLIVFPSCATETVIIGIGEFELLDQDQLIY